MEFNSFSPGLEAYTEWVKNETVCRCNHCGSYINSYGLSRDHWNPLVTAPWDHEKEEEYKMFLEWKQKRSSEE